MVGCREAREGRCDVVFTQTGGNAGDRVDVGRYEDAGVGYIGELSRLASIRFAFRLASYVCMGYDESISARMSGG